MSIYCMITITGKNYGEQFSELYKEDTVPVTMMTLGKGTASSEVLEYFGLDEVEKVVMFSMVTGETWRKRKKRMQQKLNIDIPGRGISFIVPMSSIGGKKALDFFLMGQEYEVKEETVLKNTEYELLIVVSNYGYTNLVMDAAREAGAGGGTVLHAKGTGMEKAEKFFGVMLAPEKEMTFIVTRTEKKNKIMKSVMDKAGMETKAKAVIFSLPVTETAGLRILDDEWEDEPDLN